MANQIESSKPRVLFYSPAAEFKGGAERSLMDLLSAQGIEPLVLSPGEGAVAAAVRRRGIAVRLLPFLSIGDIRRPFKLNDGLRVIVALATRARRLKLQCQQDEIDFIHSNGLKAHVVAIVARLLGAPPVVVHIRDIPLTIQERFVWRLLQIAATKLVLVSRACWPWATLPKNATVIFNGIQLREASASKTIRTEGPIVLGFFGRIHQAKGLHLLIAWMSEVLAAGIPARLTIRGTFYDEAGNYEAELHEQVRRLGLEDVVDFQPFRSDPATVYEAIDVVCVPSHVPDPLPRAVMEAMALGLPVIAYPAGGILEMIDNGKDGFLAANAEEFITALRTVLKSDVHASICANAIARAQSQFSLRRLHDSVDRLYLDLRIAQTAPGSIGATNLP